MVDDDTDYCPHCGAEMGMWDGYCDACGWDAEEEEDEDESLGTRI